MGLGANSQRFPGNAYPMARGSQAMHTLEFFNCELGPWPVAPPCSGGGKYSRESKPVANLLVLVSFTSKFTSILTNITSKFADNHRIDCM